MFVGSAVMGVLITSSPSPTFKSERTICSAAVPEFIMSRLENDITRAGFKYGMNNVNATIGSVQLRHREIISRYIVNGKYYDKALDGISGITMVPYYKNTVPSYWLYTMKVERRDDFCRMMASSA